MYCYTKPRRQLKPLFGLSILLLFFIISFTSCRKEKANHLSTIENLSIDEVLYSPDFDWSSTQVLEVNISGSGKEVINITSLNGQIRYHRCLFVGGGKEYQIKICLPKSVKQLMINQDTVSVSSPLIHTIS